MKTVALFIVGFFLYSPVNAQLPEYFVFLTHGDIWVKHEGKKLKAKPKQLIYLSDTIEIKDRKSEIELINKEYNVIALNEKGSYDIKLISGKLVRRTAGFIKKYLQLVEEAIFYASSDLHVQSNESIAASWGGGARGSDCAIGKYPPARMITSSDTIVFNWKSKGNGSQYFFQLYDSIGNSKIEMGIKDTQLVLLSHSLPLGKYGWSVNVAGERCKDDAMNKLILISKPQEDSITAAIIKTIDSNLEPVTYYMQVSDLLGSRGFIEKALEYFKKSWDLYIKE